MMTKSAEAFARLVEVVHELREKCPWDREQTWESLRPLTIEECYELLDAIARRDDHEMMKELGDVLLHVLFYSRIAEEEQRFSLADLIDTLREKLIVRHPHIYGDLQVENQQQVLENWEKIKDKEGRKSILQGVPESMPALPKAFRLQEKAASVGFDWQNAGDVVAKVKEEQQELLEAMESGDKERVHEEMGDLLFSIVNLGRKMDIDPDAALEATNRKFKHRFQFVEEGAAAQGKQLKNMTLAEMDKLWDEAKTPKKPKANE